MAKSVRLELGDNISRTL